MVVIHNLINLPNSWKVINNRKNPIHKFQGAHRRSTLCVKMAKYVLVYYYLLLVLAWSVYAVLIAANTLN